MTGNSRRKGFAAVTVRLFVLLTAACMLLAVAPRLTEGLWTRAAADSIPTKTTSSVSEINSFLTANSGEVNVVLSGNLDLTSGGITVPSGRVVNFYMNGKNMTYTNNSWQLTGFAAITNNGTLNLYSGSNANTPDTSNLIEAITLNNNRTEMNISENEHAYARLDAIINNGTLTVNKNVGISVINYVGYKDQSANRGSCTVAATGIFNTSSSAVCKVNAAKIEVLAQAHAITERTKDEIDHGRAFAYDIYGGTVTVSGESDFHANAYARMACANTAISNKENGGLITVAYNIASNGSIKVTGGNFRYGTSHACNQAVTDKGTSWCYQGSICYSNAIPTIVDGTFTHPDGSTGVRGNNTTYKEAIVTYAPVLPYSGYDLFCSNSTPGTSYNGVYDTYNEPCYPVSGVSVGRYYDEVGNTYNVTLSSTDGSHPSSILNGAVDGYCRIHVIYRFWQDMNKTAIDTSITGTDGTVGFSYRPTADQTNVVSTIVSLNGVVNTSTLQKAVNSAVSYKSGGQSKNEYYWKLFNLAYATTPKWFSEFDVTTVKGTVFKSFDGTTDNSIGAGTDKPIYVFVDYYRVAASDLVASVGTNNAATATYTGDPIKASAINLKIRDAVYSTVYNEEYDMDFTDNTLIPVVFTWTGTTRANQSVSGSRELPTDAGTYSVTLHIADSSVYNPNNCPPKTNKNRNALEYSFSLTISPAETTRGSLPENVSLTYGEKLNEKLTFNSYMAKGAHNDNVAGTFTFTNSGDGSAYKPAGSSTVYITWTPDAVLSTNYCTTSFTVGYTVEKAPLVISPDAVSAQYGDAASDIPFSITVNGLVANDNTDAKKSQIAAAVDYTILLNGSYTYYTPDDVGMGYYNIRARVRAAEVPPVLANYTYSYADLTAGYDVNQLTITKRGLTVKATAAGREYAPDNTSVDVTYEIIDGRYGVDDVRFNAGTGTVTPNTAGTQIVYGVDVPAATACMTGGKAGNYQISTLTYATGATLTVEIAKATPTVTTPVVPEMYYQRTRTLSAVTLEASGASVAGHWEWVNPTLNPTVRNSSYAARFVPNDSLNYAEKTVDVSLTILPTPVKITYNGTVEYGDAVPNITAYTYIAEQDGSFSIDAVDTEGNILPRTDYEMGLPVTEGGYAVEISLSGFNDRNGNYTFSAENGKITVVPRNLLFTVPSLTIEYGENFVPTSANVAPTCDLSRLVGSDTLSSITSNGVEPTWNYSTDYRYNDNYQVGTYEIRAAKSFATSPNYTVTVQNGVLTVTPALLTIRANTVTLPYNSEVPSDLASSYTFIGAKRGERLAEIVKEGQIAVSTNYEKGVPVNAEGYPIAVDITNATITNYTVTVENGKIIVEKATPEVRVLPTASIVFGQTLADAVFTGGVIDGDVPGEFVYGSGSIQPAYSSEPYTNYTASFVPDDSVNYNSVSGLTISLTVNKMPVTGALAVTGIPMKGDTLTVDVSGMSPDEIGAYTFTWVMEGSQINTGTQLTLDETHVGHTITVTAVAQGYYEGSKSYTTTAIAPQLPSVKQIINATAYNSYFDLSGLSVYGGTTEYGYNASQKAVTLLQKSSTLSSAVVGRITVKYNGSTEIPVNAGVYAISVDVDTPDLTNVPEGATAYSPASGIPIGTLKINPAPYNVTVNIADKTYDGFNTASAASVVETGAMTLPGGAKDDVAFDASRVVYTFEDANVGTNKSVAIGGEKMKGSAAANYTLQVTLANDAKASITPRTLEVRIDPVEREYQKDYYDVDLSFIVNAATIAPADTAASVYINEALATGSVDDYHAGLRRVSVDNVTLAGAKKDNYVLSITNLDNLTVQIEKATPSYPLPQTGTVTYNSGRTLSAISLGDSRWAWDASVSNVVPQAGSHTYTAVYTPDDQDNYAKVNYEVTMEVLKAEVVVRAASFTTIYGDATPTYYYTATGLTGADSLKTSVGGYALMNCSYETGSDVGEYEIVLTGAFTSNNYHFTYENGVVKVNPRPAYVTAIAASRPYEQGNTNVTVTFSELSNVLSGDSAYVGLSITDPITGTISDENAGVKTVAYTAPVLVGDKKDNYTLSLLNPTLTVEITKATLPGVILPTTGTVKYGARLATTEFTSEYDARGLGTFSMENPMSTAREIGTTNDVYRVMFTPTNNSNYATVYQYITLTVTTAELPVQLSLTGSADVGKTLFVSTNDLPADAYQYLQFYWYRLSDKDDNVSDGMIVASDTAEYTVAERDSDHYIACVAVNKADSPYVINARVNTDKKVTMKSMSLWQRLVKWFYHVLSSITQLFGRLGG